MCAVPSQGATRFDQASGRGRCASVSSQPCGDGRLTVEVIREGNQPSESTTRADARRQLPWGRRWLYLALGWISLGLALLGVALPLLPTTPLLLVAAFGFARSSERSYLWLTNHPRFGPPIFHWRRHRAVSLRAKWLATLSIVVIVVISAWSRVAPWILGLQVAILTVVLVFLWTRPLPPSRECRESGRCGGLD